MLPTTTGSFPRTTEPARLNLHRMRAFYHPGCVACGSAHGHGLSLDFREMGDGWVEAPVTMSREWEGYPGICHGGIVATLLDSAMTNCLFAAGAVSLTASMDIRFRMPVPSGVPLRVRGRRLECRHGVHVVESVLLRGETTLARAVAKFMPLPHNIGDKASLSPQSPQAAP